MIYFAGLTHASPMMDTDWLLGEHDSGRFQTTRLTSLAILIQTA